MQLREPIDGAGASIDLGIRIALCASRNTKQLAVVGFRRFACPPRPGPVRRAGLCAICLWIAVGRRCGLGGLRHVGREQATCGYGAKGKQHSSVHDHSDPSPRVTCATRSSSRRRVSTTCTQRDRRRVSVGSIAVAQTSYPFAVGCRKSYMRSLEIDRSVARNLSPMSRYVTTPPRPSKLEIR